MSYETARLAIETYFKAQWEALSPTTAIGYSGHAFTPTADSVRLTIQNGAVLQRSFGRPGSNKARHVGMVQVEIYVASGRGDQSWTGYVESVQDIFLNKRLTAAGVEATAAADVLVYFGADGQLPYVAGRSDDGKFTRVTVNAPFWRDEAKA